MILLVVMGEKRIYADEHILYVSAESTITIPQGKTIEIPISLYVSEQTVYFHSDSDAIQCEWGNWSNASDTVLYVTGEAIGSAVLDITNSYNKENSRIYVNVVDADEYYAKLNGAYITYSSEINNANISSYLLYDVNGDGMPELITREDTCEADYILRMYSYDDGIEYIQGLSGDGSLSLWSMSGSHTMLYAYETGGHLIFVQHHMGVVWKWEMYLDSSYCAHMDTVIADKLIEDNDPDPYAFSDMPIYVLEEHPAGDMAYLDQVFAAYGYAAN